MGYQVILAFDIGLLLGFIMARLMYKQGVKDGYMDNPGGPGVGSDSYVMRQKDVNRYLQGRKEDIC